MKVKLIRQARVTHQPGETVEVSNPAEVTFLLSTGSAIRVEVASKETPEAPARNTRSKKKG